MCIKWLKVNEILNKYYYLLVAALNRTQWTITASMGTPATNTLNIRIFPLSLFSGWIKRENNINQPGHRHTHPPHGQDGAPQFVWLMETSNMEFTVFTKHWMALLWTSEMSNSTSINQTTQEMNTDPINSNFRQELVFSRATESSENALKNPSLVSWSLKDFLNKHKKI